MRVAIYGAGGVGGYFGARLVQSGADVAFVARGKHLRAMQERGLAVKSPLGDANVAVEASDDTARIGTVDVVLVAVKTWQLDDALAKIDPLLGDETFVVPLQNGFEAADQIAARIGAARVVGGTCKIISHLGEPGEIVHVGATPWIGFGERDGVQSERTTALKKMLKAAGIAARLTNDIESEVWSKLLFVASVGGVGAVTRATIGEMRSVPETRAMLERAMAEIQSLAGARGIAVADDAVESAMGFVDALPPEGTSSLQRDIAAGRRSELDAWSGAVVRLAREHDVKTPTHDFIYASLLPQELRQRTSAGPAPRTSR